MAHSNEPITVSQVGLLHMDSRTRVRVVGEGNGFYVRIFNKNRTFELITARGDPKQYHSLGTVARLVKSWGVLDFRVDVENYIP